MRISQQGRARLRAVLGGYVERGEVPGLVAMVMHKGETYVESLGAMGLTDKRPMQRDTIFRITSMTKPVTAAATMILIEECKLRLDDPIDDLIPELANRRVLKRSDGPLDDTVPAQRAITVRDLLTFRWGFGQFMGNPATTPILKALVDELNGFGPPQPQKVPAPDEYIRRLSTLPLMVQPGERWLYDTGSEVLAVLIARASGKSFDEFLRERIFAPLGMRDTGFSVDDAQRFRLPPSYRADLQTFDEPDGQWSKPPAFASGANGLVSTAQDFMMFAQMLHDGGKRGRERLLSRASIELMTSDLLTPEQKARSGFFPGDFDNIGWGLGVSMITRRTDLASLGQYGWDGGGGTSWRNDPKQDLIGVLLTQVAWSAPRAPNVQRDFWTLAYAAIDD